MLVFFQRFVFKKIVVFIGDNGVSATLFEKNIPKEYIEINDIKENKITEFANFIRRYYKVPIYILTDVSEQSLKNIKIPSSNPLIIKKLLNRRIARDFNKNDLNNYYQLKEKNGEKNSTNFVVSNLSSVPPLSQWIEYLKNLSNPIDAIYSLPIEISNLDLNIQKILKKSGRLIIDATWSMIVLQSKLGGFRIVVLRNSHLIFTRLLSYENIMANANEVEALKNQILGTVEYLRRIGYRDKQGINIYTIFTENLQKILPASAITGYNAIYIKPDELSKLIYEDVVPQSRSNTIEQDISAYFIKKGKYIPFYTKTLMKISSLNNINMGLNIFILFSLFFFIIFQLFNVNKINTAKNNIDKYQFKITSLSSTLENIRQEKFGFDIDEDRVIEVSRIHQKLQSLTNDPLELTIKLSQILPHHVKVKNFQYRLDKESKIILKVNGIFLVEDLSYEELFSKYDTFIRDIKTEFNGYSIQHSDLPDTINFNQKLDDMPINFEIREGR
jgi:hypothetical protein